MMVYPCPPKYPIENAAINELSQQRVIGIK
jgi:hypothetical protein